MNPLNKLKEPSILYVYFPDFCSQIAEGSFQKLTSHADTALKLINTKFRQQFEAATLRLLKNFSTDVWQAHEDGFVVNFSGLKRLYRKGFFRAAEDCAKAIESELGFKVRWSLGTNQTKAALQARFGQNTPLHTVEWMECLKAAKLSMVMDFSCENEAHHYSDMRLYDFIHMPLGKVRGYFGKPGLDLWYELQGWFCFNAGNYTSSSLAQQKETPVRNWLSLPPGMTTYALKKPKKKNQIRFVPALIA